MKLCFMDTDTFAFDIEAEDFYKDIAENVVARSDKSGYPIDDNRSLPIGKNKKVSSRHDER